MEEKMDSVIVISDDDDSDEEGSNDGDDSDEEQAECARDKLTLDFERDMEMAIRLSLESMATSSSSSSKSKKPSKRASMHNRTWCKIRQEKQNSKQWSDSIADLTPTIDEDSNDLPDLDSNEECIYVQVFEEEINDDSDCMIVDDYQSVSGGCTTTSHSKPDKSVINESQRSAFTYLENNSKVRDLGKTEGSLTDKVLDSQKQSSKISESSKESDNGNKGNIGRKLPILSSEGRAKLANILRTVNNKGLHKSKSLEESNKGHNSSEKSTHSEEKWPFTIERHFSDILSGGCPQENKSTENSTDKVLSAGMLSPPAVPAGSFRPVSSRHKCSPVLERQMSTPSAFTDTIPTKSPGLSPTPSKRLRLGRCISATSDNIMKNNYEIVNMKLGKSISLDSNIHVPKRRIVRKSDEVVLESGKPKPSDVRNFFKPIPSSSTYIDMPSRTLKDWQNIKPFNMEFPAKEGLEDSLSLKLSKMHIDTIGVCFEEEGPYCLRHAIKFIYDFSLKYAPTSDIIKQLLFKGILENSQVDLMYSSYRTLKLIQQRYPGTIQIDWETLKLVMDNINLGLGFVQQDVVILLRISLFLQLTVTCYEDDLYYHDVVDPKGLRQSMAFKCLTSDSMSYTGCVKQLTNWVVCSLTYGEFQEVQEISSPFFRERNPGVNQSSQTENVILRQEVRKLLPLLQRLLKIAIDINLSCSDCARTCASELIKSFVYLSLGYKKLLLQTMQSSLLQFKLVILMLENNCECDTFSYYEFPSGVRDVMENLFQAQPPRLMNTPPTTPQSEEEEEAGAGRLIPKVSSVAVEELAMLQYYALLSYLQCLKAKSHVPLRVRVKLPEKEFGSLSPENVKELEKLPTHIEELRGHYLQLAVDLTQDTEKYLMMMLCLKDTTSKF
ncbi:uncharacterized protein LOC132546941 [Ylistrum balloti]|uniref:uncharacterized protein LOC132546941 n=1 Tax=Ylistrum balloti TaxID=509963 RepID=UPI002905E94C|nr:uncharacterized protein LOC132546941 [Ylistrum balloti]